MGVLQKLAGALGYEKRAGLFSTWPLTGSAGASSVNTRLAENLSTTTACVNAVASAIGSLPAYVYRRTAGGRVEDVNHPVARLLRRPNDRLTWPDWIELTIGDVLLRGNALSAIETDGAGQPVALVPVPWSSVSPIVLPSGRLAFDIVSGAGIPRRLLAEECFHLKDRSDDGWLGRSRISRAPDVLTNAMELQTWSTALWSNAVTPAGVVKFDKQLDQKSFDRIQAAFNDRYTGSGNARKTLILDNGASWQALSVSPEDAEVLSSRRFSVEELCRLFQVPPPIVQDYTHGTFTNAEQAALWFAQFSLTPWCRKIEAEFHRSVFGAASVDHTLEIDLSGLMRGDYAARWTANVAAVTAGILDANEVREAEGYNPRPAQPPAQPPASPA